VYIAGRNEERVSAAIKELESEGIKDGSLHFLKIDLADPRLAKQAGEEFLRKETRLDVLGPRERCLYALCNTELGSYS
jgi:NADP-dependent 3-hydroxy acid dehydrogenase YdfG